MLRLISFNIRYDEPRDGANAWPARRSLVTRLLEEWRADVVGLQEVLPGQKDDLAADLPFYRQAGLGRDGGGRGEHCLILWRDPWRLIDQGTFWLSGTPDEVSRGWDACLPRVCSWVRLEAGDRELSVFNLHLDHLGAESRHQGLTLVRRYLAGSAVLMGDFNDESLAVPGLVEARPPGDRTTFHDFRGGPGPQLDYIYCTPDLRPREARIDRRHENGRYPSDHYPLVADLDWA